MDYTLIYRPNIKYCNYRCSYCPFSKYSLKKDSLEKDKQMLYRFVEFLKENSNQFKILFAPKGEILGFNYYKKALEIISKLENINEVVIQTNLSSDLNWLENVNKTKLKLWVTYHPSEISMEDFLIKINTLVDSKTSFSVGVVGIKENIAQIKELKLKLSNINKNIYLWVNAYKDEKNYYAEKEIDDFKEVDEYFSINNENYKCNNENCSAGKSTFWVEGNGIIHRCYKDNNPLGSIYKNKLSEINTESMKPSLCTCYTGYIHLKDLKLESLYKTSLLARIK